MIPKKSSLLVSLIFIAFFSNSHAQKFGAIIASEEPSQILEEFKFHQSIGINDFIIKGKIPFETIFTLDTLGVSIWVASDFQYKIAHNILGDTEKFRKSITDLIIHYRTSSSVKGFLLLWATQHTEEFDSYFDAQLPRFQDQTKQKLALAELQHLKGSFKEFGYRFSLINDLGQAPFSTNEGIYIQGFGQEINLQLLQRYFSNLDESAVMFLPGSSILVQPELVSFIQQKNRFPATLVSTEYVDIEYKKGNWVIILLLIVWLSYAIHFAFEPTYRKSIGRFFFNHSFFANDILNRHERIGFSSVIVLVQIISLAGIMFETVFSYFFDEMSRQVLVENIQIIKIFDLFPFGYFILGILISSFIIGVSIVWLRFGLPNIKFFTQVTPIYTWFYHANLVFIPLVIVATMMNPPNPWILAIGLLGWFFVTFGAFILVCIDDAKQNPTRKQAIYAKTLYPYITAIILVTVILNYFGVLQAIKYAYQVGF